MSDMAKAMAYLLVGCSFLAFMVVDDFNNGRKFQRRDFQVVVYWPILVFVVFILGLFEFSRITSKLDLYGKPDKWVK
jgi:hypothetical protein